MKMALGKKLFVATTLSIMALSSISMAHSHSMDVRQASQNMATSADTQMNVTRAIHIAQTKVGGDVVHVDFDHDHQGEYEVTLINGSQKHEVSIHAQSGKIIKIEKEYADYEDKNELMALRKAKISLPQAVIKAQNNAAKVMDVEFDVKNGLGIYEMEVIQNGQTYEMDMNPNTGEILNKRLAS